MIDVTAVKLPDHLLLDRAFCNILYCIFMHLIFPLTTGVQADTLQTRRTYGSDNSNDNKKDINNKTKNKMEEKKTLIHPNKCNNESKNGNTAI